MSSSSHPGGAGAPPGGHDRRRAAGPGSAPAVRLLDDDADRTLRRHLGGAAARAQSASCNDQSEPSQQPEC